MEGIYQEFENENSLRTYPFASGCEPTGDPETEIPPEVFVDAAIYPINPSGVLYLSGVSEDGVFSVSDDSGVIMSGTASGSVVELYETEGRSRHVGTLVASSSEALEDFAGRAVERSYSRYNTAFASNCVFPVVVDGVTSVSVGGAGSATREVSFVNDSEDVIRVSSMERDGVGRTLRFDIVPRAGGNVESIKNIICVVDGKTPFRISKLSDNVVMLSLEGIDKEVVCAAAHRENDYEMSDTCDCDKQELPRPMPVPDTFQVVNVRIPPMDEDGSDGADNAFFLVVPNILGYDNPLSITMEDGIVVPKADDVEVVVGSDGVDVAEGELMDKTTSKGIVIQVPGLSGGLI